MARTHPPAAAMRTPRALVVAATLLSACAPPAPPVGCAAGEHDGGGGKCASEGQCAEGYTLESAGGRCSRWRSLPDLIRPRIACSANTLGDGRVVVAGGGNDFFNDDIAEIFDPATRTWTGGASVAIPRRFQVSVLLADKTRVIYAGGETPGGGSSIGLSEVYDAAADTWTEGPSIDQPEPGVFLQRDGRLRFVAGHDDVVIDDIDHLQVHTEPGPLVPRAFGAVVGAPDGSALLAGGAVPTGGGFATFITEMERFDPDVGAWVRLDDRPFAKRTQQAAGLADDHTVMVAGGQNGQDNIDTSFTVDLATHNIAHGPALATAASFATGLSMNEGGFLVVGGASVTEVRADVQLFGADGSVNLLPPLLTARTHPCLAELADGSVLVAGGADSKILGESELLDRAP